MYYYCQMNTFFCLWMSNLYFLCCTVLISCHGTSFKGLQNLTVKHIKLLNISLENYKVSSKENNLSQVKINPVTSFYSLYVDFIHWNNNKQPIFSSFTRNFPSVWLLNFPKICSLGISICNKYTQEERVRKHSDDGFIVHRRNRPRMLIRSYSKGKIMV